MRNIVRTVLLCVATSVGSAGAHAAEIAVHTDLREAPRGLLHASIRIQAKPGPMTLLYARWIAGEHGPTGPVTNLAITKISAGGRAIEWRRDLENMFAFHVEVPVGATELEVAVDYLAPASGGNFGSGPMNSAKLAVLNWFLVTLFPAGPAAADITVTPSVTLPDGWDFGTSLETTRRAGATVTFKPLSLEMLLDQPVIAGAMMKHFELTPGRAPAHVIDCAADSEEALVVSPERLKTLERIPLEYAALFGTRCYENYHFLLSLSERTGFDGVEHHQCSDNRMPARTFIDEDELPGSLSLLTHEFFHAWNGKHRRPAGLLSPDYQKPIHTDLLWVYEGLTQYYGLVMAARSGLMTGDIFREQLASVDTRLTRDSGRTWRPLQDTADSAQLLYQAGGNWQSRRRGVDFYDEGTLIWLEADVLIRRKSGGQRSLDDFVRLFFGDGGAGVIDVAKVPGRTPSVVTYEAADVLAALNKIEPYDWEAFFANRLTSLRPEAPMGGIAGAGWKVVYTDTVNKADAAWRKHTHVSQPATVIGLAMNAEDHTIIDVIAGSPADRAGAGPGMKIVAVNGRMFSDVILEEALKAAGSQGTIDVLVENTGYLSSLHVQTHGGAQEPHLERVEGTDDLLAAILKPRM
jgi:predicted metalloprotease with PDZ domain